MPSFNVTTTSQQVLPPKNRKAVIFVNHSDAALFLSITGNAQVTAAAGPNAGLPLAPGASLTLGPNSGTANNRAVYAVHASSGDKELRYEEVL